MTRLTVAMTVAVMFGVAGGSSAQTATDHPMSMSGCITAGKSAGQYMLTNAMMGGAMDKDKMAKPGMGGQMMSYALAGGSNLKAHMGHKVEVMGTMSKMDMDAMGKMDKMSKMDRDKMMAGKNMKAMTLNVTSVKMVSATCP